MKKIKSQILPGFLFCLFCLVATSAPSGCPLPCADGDCTMAAWKDSERRVHCPDNRWTENCCSYRSIGE